MTGLANDPVSHLRTVRLAGPVVDGSGRAVWEATLTVVRSSGPAGARPLLERQMGMRVLSEDTELRVPQRPRFEPDLDGTAKDETFADVRLREPVLLTLHVADRPRGKGESKRQWSQMSSPLAGGSGYDMLLSVPAGSAGQTVGRPVAAVPAAPWPMPQWGQEPLLPTLRLSGTALPVWLDVTGGTLAAPAGFLSFADLGSSGGQDLVAALVRQGVTDSATLEQGPRLVMDATRTPVDGAYRLLVPATLTPEGIELEGRLTTAGLTDGKVRVRVTAAPSGAPAKVAWQLVPVEPAGGAGAAAQPSVAPWLSRLDAALRSAEDAPVALLLNTGATLSSFSWPLESPAQGTGSGGPALLRLGARPVAHMAADAVRLRLNGDRPAGGSIRSGARLPVTAVRLEVAESGSSVSISLDYTPQEKSPIGVSSPPADDDVPILRLHWNAAASREASPQRKVELAVPDEAADEGPALTWFEAELAARLLDRAGTTADGLAANDRDGVGSVDHGAFEPHTWAFVALEDGWLQWPLPLPHSAQPAPVAHAVRRMPLDGAVLFDLYDGPAQLPVRSPASHRLLTLTAGDRARVELQLEKASDRYRLQRARVDIMGAQGTVEGLLWVSARPPAAGEALPAPTADAGGLFSPRMAFGQPRRAVDQQGLGARRWVCTRALTHGASGDGGTAGKAPIDPLGLVPDPGPPADVAWPAARVWVCQSELPLVTAVPMTRAVQAVGRPDPYAGHVAYSAAVVNRSSAARLALVLRDGAPLPAAAVVSGRVGDWPPVHEALRVAPLGLERPATGTSAEWPADGRGVTLVPVTLPGVDIDVPSQAELTASPVRLWHELPLLQALFAAASLPSRGQGTRARPMRVSGLDPEGFGRVQRDNLRRWRLARSQDALALGLPDDKAERGVPAGIRWQQDSELAGWALPFTLKVNWRLDKNWSPGGYSGAASLPFGSYTLDPLGAFATVDALAGVTRSFQIDGKLLTTPSGGTDTLHVAGSAAGLVPPQGPNGSPPMLRDNRALALAAWPDERTRVWLRQGRHGESPMAWLTLRRPVELSLPGSSPRQIRFWCRDLPVVRADTDPLRYPFEPGDPIVGSHWFNGAAEWRSASSQAAFDAERLPVGSFEWRLAADPVGEQQDPRRPEEAFLIGAFLFQPMRLLSAAFQPDAEQDAPVVSRLVVGGLLHLPHRQRRSGDAGGPYGADAPPSGGVMMALELRGEGAKLVAKRLVRLAWKAQTSGMQTLARDALRPACFDIPRVAVFWPGKVPVKSVGDEQQYASVRLVLTPTPPSAGDQLWRPFQTAELKVTLFGRRLSFRSGQITAMGDGGLEICFERLGTTQGTGVLIRHLALSWASAADGKVAPLPVLVVRAELTVRTVDRPARLEASAGTAVATTGRAETGVTFASVDLGEMPTLRLGCTPGIPFDWNDIRIDHRSGLIRIAYDGRHKSEVEPYDLQPAVGLAICRPIVRMSLVMVTGAEPAPDPGIEPWVPAVSGSIDVEATGRATGTGSSDVQEWVSIPSHTVTRIRLLASSGGDIGSAASEEDGGPWLGRLTLDLHLRVRSLIGWPAGALKLPTEESHSQPVGQAAIGKMEAGTAPLRHFVDWKLIDAALPFALLSLSGPPGDPLIALSRPWRLRGPAQHTLRDDSGRTLRWSQLQEVLLHDAPEVLAAAQHSLQEIHASPEDLAKIGRFSFAARYRNYQGDQVASNVADPAHRHAAVKAGLVTRPWAHVGWHGADMARHWEKSPGAGGIRGCLIWSATPALLEGQGGNRLLSLPWMVLGGGDDQAVDRLCGHSDGWRQCPDSQPLTVTASDIDWAADDAVEPQSPVAILALLQAQRMTTLDAALRPWAPQGLRWSEPVEQGLAVVDRNNAAIHERPLWLRSLVAVKRLWETQETSVELRATSLLSHRTDRGRPAALPVRLGEWDQVSATASPRGEQDQAKPATESIGRRLLVLGWDGRRDIELPASAGTDPAEVLQSPRSRELALALLAQPVAMLVVQDAGEGLLEHVRDGTDVRGLGAGVRLSLLSGLVSQDDDGVEQLTPSAALGWPSCEAIEKQGARIAGLLGDRPFQDQSTRAVETRDRALPSAWGTGLAGRRAEMLYARGAETGSSETPSAPPVWLAFGRTVAFERPSDDDLTLLARPAPALHANATRLVAPPANRVEKALAALAPGRWAPLVPGGQDRMSVGLRPGAMHLEWDALLTADPDTGNGPGWMPAHAGPLALRQVRFPRGVPYPRFPKSSVDLLLSHGRRTFVTTDDVEKSGATTGEDCHFVPFRWIDGTVQVLQLPELSADGDLERLAGLWVGLCGSLPLTGWDGTLELLLQLPPAAARQNDAAKQLLSLLRAVGLAGSGEGGEPASLTSAQLSTAGAVLELHGTWLQAPGSAGSAKLQLRPRQDDPRLPRFRQALEQAAAQGEPAQLVLRFGPRPNTSARPGNVTPALFADRVSVQLPVPLVLGTRPRLSLPVRTLVFSDPAYDRSLAGSGLSDSRRPAGSGRLWLLACDRPVYGPDTPLYFAFGKVTEPASSEPVGFDKDAEQTGTFRVRWLRKSGQAVQLNLQVETNPQPSLSVPAGVALTVGLSDLRDPLTGAPPAFEEGDRLQVTLSFSEDGSQDMVLAVQPGISVEPVIAGPSAVYSLAVVGGEPVDSARTWVALHGVSPLPARIGFVDLLGDLAKGRIRRFGQFEWRMVQTRAGNTQDRATLVKIDRTGCGQLPEGNHLKMDVRPLDQWPPASA